MPARPKPRATASSLAEALKPRLVADPARTKMWMAELRAADGAVALAAPLKKAPVASFLAAVMGCSPFLRSLILDDPARVAEILGGDPAARLKQVTAAAAAAWRDTSEAELMAALRRARQEVALTVCARRPRRAVGTLMPSPRRSPSLPMRGRGGSALPAAARGRRRRDRARRCYRAGRGLWLDRARHGQVRRRRAQLFQRHRPHRALRPRAHPARG